jgi:hypothetical protein
VITKKGFKTNREKNNNTYILIKIIEKAYEYSVQINKLLTDLKQSFDISRRHKTTEILQLQGTTSKLVRLIRMLLEDSQTAVVIENYMTESFNVKVGVSI